MEILRRKKRSRTGQKRQDRKSRTEKTGQKDTQGRILKLIEENPSITQDAISKQIGMARSGIAEHIRKMKERGIIERVGSDRKGYWKIL